jgi:hypothetical protein
MQGRPAARVKVTLRGGGLGAGREGHFTYDLSAASAGGVAAISGLTLHGTLAAAMDTPRTFTRLALQGEAAVSGTQFPRGVKLGADVAAARAASGESYTLTLAGEGRQLAAAQVEFPAAGSKLNGTWKLDVRDADLAPFALGLALPVFAATGEGRFETDATFTEIHASGRLQATADKLSVIKPELAAVGALQISADFDVSQHGDATRVERLQAAVTGAAPVLTVQALQAFEFNAKTGELKVADPNRELLGIVLQGVPLAWAQPFLKDIAATGGDLRGEFVASARDGGLALRPKAPLTVANLSIAQAGKPLLRALDISLTASADYTPQGWQAELAPLVAKSGPVTLLTLDAKAGQLAGKDQPIKATGHLNASLPGLLAQPVAANVAQLTRGDAAVEFAASLGAKQQIQAKLAVTNLVADPKLTTEKLPTITTDARVDRDTDGKLSLNVPLLFEREGRKTDLAVTGTLLAGPGGLSLDATLTSTLLVVGDVKVLAAPLVPAPAPAVAAAPGKPSGRDAAPPWAGVSGQLTLALKKVIYSDAFQVTDVGGTVRLEAGSLKLETVRAGLGEGSDVKVSGGVVFDPKAAEPYALKADVAVNNFDSVPLFRAIDPSKPATVEGKFNITSQVSGGGPNLALLAERVHGDFLLSSKGGVFRALAADVSEKVQKSQAAVSALGGLLGAVTGKDKISDYANRTQIITDIAKVLAEIPFDQLSVSVARDADLNINLQDFTLISPDVRIGGTGTVTYKAGVPPLAQALDFHLQLGARGKTAELMKRASLLSGTQDSLGYASFVVPVRIGGTIENPDTSDLRNALLKAAGGSLLNSLLGK